MIADMIRKKERYTKATELLIRGQKLNISLVFITQLYFLIPKDLRLNNTTFSILRFQTDKSFNKLQLIIRLIMALRNLKDVTKHVLPQSHIDF